MELKALSLVTDCIFAKFNGEVIDRGNYILVQTRSNPTFHGGNYIIFDSPPKKGDYEKWRALFKTEFDYYEQMNHYLFTWQQEVPGDIEEFTQNNFELEIGTVLSTEKVLKTPKYNSEIEVRPLKDNEWNDATEMAILTRDDCFSEESYRTFKTAQMKNYQRMVEANKGHWYGAFLNGKLVGDLGLFHGDGLGRFQNVTTHPGYRRLGVCQTLVYEAASYGLNHYPIETLVMEADPEYHAAKIYEKVGFQPTEKSYSLTWHTSMK